MKTDLGAEKTEKEWQSSFDKFIRIVTPTWFTWLGWVLILGALSILSKTTQSLTVTLVYGATFILFIFYFISYFYQFEFENIPVIHNKHIARVVSILIPGLLGWGLIVLFNSLAIALNINGI